jgi:hypothetical protein
LPNAPSKLVQLHQQIRFTSTTTAEAATTTARVHLTDGNRPGYRGNRPYRPGPVTVLAGYQPVGSKKIEFDFQKLKIVEKIPKNTS